MKQASIAIIGASTNREKYGNKAVRAFKQQGYQVYPVNPSAAEIEGIACYKSVLDIPVTPEMASLYLPPEVGIKVIEDIARKGITKVWFNPGSESDELLARTRELGMEAIAACSILAISVSPDEL